MPKNMTNVIFRTVLPVNRQDFTLNPNTLTLLAGSCFADHIGQRLHANKFPVKCNPFGTLFNPISIFNLLSDSLNHLPPNPDRFVQRDGHWVHFDFHSECFAAEKDGLGQKLVQQLQETGDFLQKSDFLFLTLGTAWVYQLKADGQTVANCHKVPASAFEKVLLSPEEIVKSFTNLYKLLPKNQKIILTVSPVRHIKDTLPLNAVSKSVLRLACHHLQEQFPNVHYYPAFEILTDDLRDYRFYQPDMLHPSETAVDYIWQHFSQTFFSDETLAFLAKWEKIKTALEHRPLQAGTPAHRAFLEKLLIQLNELKGVTVTEELNRVLSQIRQYFPNEAV